jgi:hypothetical protein
MRSTHVAQAWSTTDGELTGARAALDRFCRWCDAIQVAELSWLARAVRAWEAEILAFHSTQGCSNRRPRQ